MMRPDAWLAEERQPFTGRWIQKTLIEEPAGPRYRNIMPLYTEAAMAWSWLEGWRASARGKPTTENPYDGEDK